MFRTLSALLLILITAAPAAAPGPGPAAGPALLDVPGPLSAGPGDESVNGTIEGVVRMQPVRQRRAATRYPAGAAAARTVQEIPAVVYLKGRVRGAPAPVTGAVMAQRDTVFAPPLLVVPVGTVVRFPNHDPFFHNVFSYSSAARFDLGRYVRGESKDVRFDEPGAIKIYCEVHETMRAAVIVVENTFWSLLDDEGRFRIEGVPPGTHTLVAWHTDRGEREREVTVPASGTVRVEMDL